MAEKLANIYISLFFIGAFFTKVPKQIVCRFRYLMDIYNFVDGVARI